ncbi:hypothetical protein Tco_0392182, partial [Tanacetum coccineum]
PGSFLPPILLLVIVVVSVAVVVVVVVVSLVVFPLPFIAFTNSGCPTLNCLLNQPTGHDTSRPTHGNDCCMPQCCLLLESKSRALAPSFGFQLLGSIP